MNDVVLQRQSACPVHFIWDAPKPGQILVRMGFMLLLVAGMLTSLAVWLHSTPLRTSGMSLAAVAIGAWLLGHARVWWLRLKR